MKDHFRRTLAATMATAVVAGGLLAAPIGASAQEAWQGVDDGTTLTMWSRAATEDRVRQIVDAYNASHKNQVD